MDRMNFLLYSAEVRKQGMCPDFFSVLIFVNVKKTWLYFIAIL